jgi:hypothetical protein
MSITTGFVIENIPVGCNMHKMPVLLEVLVVAAENNQMLKKH